MRTDVSSFELPLSNAEDDAYEFLTNDVMLRDDVLDDVTDDNYISNKSAESCEENRLASSCKCTAASRDKTGYDLLHRCGKDVTQASSKAKP